MSEHGFSAHRVALIVASAFFMQNLDSSIITTSLPQMAQSFGVEATRLSIGVTAYVLAVAVFLPLSGWLADRLGARNVFAGAIVVFTVASLACAMSTNLWTFAIARAVQGLGGALMAPVGRMVVLKSASKAQLLQATAVITWPALAAPVLGPALGGLITSTIGWRWNFLLNLPLGLAGVALVLAFIPNDKAAVRRPLDVRGFLLSAVALAALLYGMENLAALHGQGAAPAALIAVGVIFAGLTVRHLTTAKHPLVDLSTFKVPTFAITQLVPGTLFRIGISATPFLLPLLFQLIFGLSAWQAGMMILIYFAGNLGMKTVTTPILRRFGFRPVLAVNGALSGLSVMAFALFAPGASTLWMGAVLLIAGLTRSMQFTGLNTLAFADVADHQRGSASTLSSMAQQISMCLGIALGAGLLNGSQALRGAQALSVSDFRVAFIGVGLASLASAFMFLKLDRDAGWEVSGRSAPAQPRRAA